MWHVLYVKPRCEKKAAEVCKALGQPHYLPLRRETKIYQRRKVTVDKPVFPSYFFASFDRDGRLKLLQSNYILRTMETVDQRSLLHQLAQVRKALRVDPTLASCLALKRGRTVRITGGPFQGVEGVVSAVRGMTKVRLNVELIGQAISVEISREFLEVAD